jgi:hypothetical protein
MIYTILAVIAAFSGGVYIGWYAALAGFVSAVKRGTMHELIHDYEEAFGTPIQPKE